MRGLGGFHCFFCDSSLWHCSQSAGWLPVPGRVGELLLLATSPASYGTLGSEGMIWVISIRCADPQWGWSGFLTEKELRFQRHGTRAALWFSPFFFQAVLSLSAFPTSHLFLCLLMNVVWQYTGPCCLPPQGCEQSWDSPRGTWQVVWGTKGRINGYLLCLY